MDHRPSDLDPYPRFGRDLATLELWDQSLERSRQRRRLEAASRSHRQRRKGTSIAVGAAMLAAPVVPAFAGGSRGGSPKGASGQGGRADTAGRHVVAGRRDRRPDGVAALRRRRPRGDRDPAPGRRDRRRDLRPDHPRRGRALPARPRARHDGDRRRAHVGGAVQRARALLRRPGLARGCRPAGGGGAAGLGAPRGGPERVGGAGVAGRDGRGVVGRGRRRLVSRVVGSSGRRGPRAPGRPSRGRARAGPLRSRARPRRRSTPRPAPKQTTPAPTAPAPTTSAGGCTSGRIVSPVSGATLTGRFGESRPGHLHAGDDLAVASGTPIHAAQCGTVVQSGRRAGLRPDGLHPPRRRDHHVLRPHVPHGGDGEPAGPGRPGHRLRRVHRQLHRPARALRGAPRRDRVDPAPYLAGTQTIAGTTSTASAAHATAASTRRTTTTSAGTSSRATVRAAVVRSSATGGVEAGAAALRP